MELQGKVIAVLPERSGVSARGEWKAQSFADRLAQFNIQSGEELLVSFDLDAHEYNGRWFNSVRAWNVQRIDPNAVAGAMGGMQPGAAAFPPMGAAPMGAAPAAAPAAGATAPFPASQPAAPAQGGSADDLPF